jgi:hypothetical protein
MVTTMGVAVLWDVMLCSLVDLYNCYTGMCWFCHQGSTGTHTHWTSQKMFVFFSVHYAGQMWCNLSNIFHVVLSGQKICSYILSLILVHERKRKVL